MKPNNPGCNCCRPRCQTVCGDSNWLVIWRPEKQWGNPAAASNAQLSLIPFTQPYPGTAPKLTFTAPPATVIEGNKTFSIPGSWLDAPDPSKGDWTNATLTFTVHPQSEWSILPHPPHPRVVNDIHENVWAPATTDEYADQPSVPRYSLSVAGVAEGDDPCQLGWNDFQIDLLGSFVEADFNAQAVRYYQSICDLTVHCAGGAAWPPQLLATVSGVTPSATNDGTLCGNINSGYAGNLVNNSSAVSREQNEAHPEFRAGHQFELALPNTLTGAGNEWWSNKPAWQTLRYAIRQAGTGDWIVNWYVTTWIDCRPDCSGFGNPDPGNGGIQQLGWARWSKDLGTSAPLDCSDLSVLSVGPADFVFGQISSYDHGYSCDYSGASIDAANL